MPDRPEPSLVLHESCYHKTEYTFWKFTFLPEREQLHGSWKADCREVGHVLIVWNAAEPSAPTHIRQHNSSIRTSLHDRDER